MGRLRIAAVLILLSWLGISPASADIDPSEYELKTSIRSEKERQRMKALLQAEKETEDERRQLEDTAEVSRLAEVKAAWDSLPYAVRVTETRCTGCHIADNFTKQRHNHIGWSLVVLRMQYMNDVRLDEGERSVIAAHLAQNYPASGVDAVMELIIQMLAVLTLPALWLVSRGARARRRMRAHMQNAGASLASVDSSQNGQKLTREK